MRAGSRRRAWLGGNWVLALLACAATAKAQPRHERRVFSQVMTLRHRLAQECRDADDSTKRDLAELLLDRSDGHALGPLGRALARVRGVEPDPPFMLRHALMVLPTPEVVDAGVASVGEATPPQSVPSFDHVNVTVHLPYRHEIPGVLEFRLTILDAAGEERWRGCIDAATELSDLLRFRATTRVPVDGFPDGMYRVVAETWIEGVAPRPHDPRAEAWFAVRRGFPSEALRLNRALGPVPDGPVDRDELAWRGVLHGVKRVFEGEPPAGASQPLVDLEAAHAVAENRRGGRAALAGLAGWVAVAVRLDDDGSAAARACVRLRPPQEGETPAPAALLVVLVPGAPAWSVSWSRPQSPRSTAPEWGRDLLRGAAFDLGDRVALAVLESPGRWAGAGGTLATCVKEVRALVGGADRVLLIGEREGATAVLQALAREPELAGAAALVAGGAIDAASAAGLADHAFLLVPAHGHPGNGNLLRAGDLLEKAGARVDRLDAAPAPWSLALALAVPEIEALAARLLREAR
ncbi:MAG: hypothetical protein AAF628_37525 [Planctomycetota bacterium]